VKVLDFGLAKLTQLPDSTAAAPLTAVATSEGVVMGTPSYMSPEQARGLSVDKRTDIWAFGCVLYEMLAGREAFPGATASDRMAAVLEREPDLPALPLATPPAVRDLLRRCLEKDPKRRLRDIGDAQPELEEPGVRTQGIFRSDSWRRAATMAISARCRQALALPWRFHMGLSGLRQRSAGRP
jgi:serine/threonine protein kinase